MPGELWAVCCWVQGSWNCATAPVSFEHWLEELHAVTFTSLVSVENDYEGRGGAGTVERYVFVTGKERRGCSKSVKIYIPRGHLKHSLFDACSTRKRASRNTLFETLSDRMLLIRNSTVGGIDAAQEKKKIKAAQKSFVEGKMYVWSGYVVVEDLRTRYMGAYENRSREDEVNAFFEVDENWKKQQGLEMNWDDSEMKILEFLELFMHEISPQGVHDFV